MDPTKLAEALQESSFGAFFPKDVMQSLAIEAKWKICPRGTVLFREGDQSDAFYVIHHGHVTLEMCLPAHGCTQLLTLGAGEIVAWSALVGEGKMTANALAADDVELIEFSGSALLKRCETDPLFGYHLMRQMAAALAKRLLATRLQMLDLYMADSAANNRGSL